MAHKQIYEGSEAISSSAATPLNGGTDLQARRVVVAADDDNTSFIRVGGPAVLATTGPKLQPGDSVEFLGNPVLNVASIFGFADVNNEKLDFFAEF